MAMKLFRTFGQSRASKVMLGVLVLAFAGWGITDYIGGRTGAALTINGEDVPLREIDQTYRNRVATITQMLGGEAPTPEMLQQLNVPQMVMTEVLHRHVLQQAAEKLRLQPSKAEVRDTVMGNKAFATDGTFDAERYRKSIAQMGFTPKAFERLLADELAVQKLAGIVNLPKPDAAAVAPLLASQATTYKLETFTLTTAELPPQAEPTVEELTAFYQANQSVYSTPEKRSVAVLEIGPHAISGSISIPEEQIEARFKENAAAYEKPEMRHVRHILVPDAKQAVELYNKLKAGEDFAKLAGEFSQDPGSKDKGGDLGNIAKADVVPAFGDAAFKLEAGGLSEPVQSPFGWHVIKVESITQPGTVQLAEVRERIKEELIAEQSEETLNSLLKTVDDRAAGGESLAKIAEATGLKTRNLPLLTAGMVAAEVEPALVQAAFSAEEGSVQGPVTLGNGTLAYLEITALTPAKVQPLAEVKDKVRGAFMEARKQDSLKQSMQNLLGALSQPQFATQPIEAVAQQVKFAGGKAGTLTLTDVASAPEWLHPAVSDIYQLPVNGVLQAPVPNGKDLVLVRLIARQRGAPADAQAAADAYGKALQTEMEGLLLKHLVATARIKQNPTLLRQVFGATWNPS